MSELTFTKSFLTNLDSKPQKYSADYVFPPSSFTPRTPFTLPKLPHPPYPLPPQPTTAAPPPGSTASDTVTLVLKSSRNPPLDVTLSNVSASETTIAQLREAVRKDLEAQGSVADVSKIKVLYNKKPIPPSKNTVADAIGNDVAAGKTIELGIMILGGISTPTPGTPSMPAAAPEPMEGLEKVTSPSPAQGPSGQQVLETVEFWDDLQGFLEQRLKDETEAARLRGIFKNAWRA